MHDSAVLYTRELPGGGYVYIERTTSDDTTYHARLWVERRTDPARRAGHAPPVLAEADGPSDAAVYDALLPIAGDNVAIAREIMRWQQKRPR